MTTPQCTHTTENLAPGAKENDYIIAEQLNGGFRFKGAEEKDFDQNKHRRDCCAFKYSNILIIYDKSLSEDNLFLMHKEFQRQLRGD